MHVRIEIRDQDSVMFQEICIKTRAFSAALVGVSFRNGSTLQFHSE